MDWSSGLEITTKKVEIKGVEDLVKNTTSTTQEVLGSLIPRLGNRTGNSSSREDIKSDDELGSPEMSWDKMDPPMPPPRARKTGWGEEIKSARFRGTVVDSDQFVINEKDLKHDDIPVIPDLDEIIEDTDLAEIPNAPSIGINRAATYRELDTELIKNSSFASLDHVDLGLLTENLVPEKIVKEPDEVWSWESLFIQVASEINSELQTKT